MSDLEFVNRKKLASIRAAGARVRGGEVRGGENRAPGREGVLFTRERSNSKKVCFNCSSCYCCLSFQVPVRPLAQWYVVAVGFPAGVLRPASAGFRGPQGPAQLIPVSVSGFRPIHCCKTVAGELSTTFNQQLLRVKNIRLINTILVTLFDAVSSTNIHEIVTKAHTCQGQSTT